MRKKYREDKELIALSKLGDTKAQKELWDKWNPFTQKQYFMSREAFTNAGMTFEDYMQEAYLAFVTAIDKYDLKKAIDKGCVNFSTYYYWYLVKLRNGTLGYLEKWGDMKYSSDYESNVSLRSDASKADAKDNEWNRATLRNISDDFKQDECAKIIDVYFEEEESSLFKNIVSFLLMGYNAGEIVHLLDDEYSYGKVRKMIDEIFAKIRNIAIRYEYEPISIRV